MSHSYITIYIFVPKFNTMKTLEERVNPEKLNKAAEMLRVAAHPQRLAILDLLRSGKHYNNSELQELLGIEQPILSQHLTLMRDKGLLNCTKEGKFAHYSIRYEDFHFIIDCIENCCTKL